MLINIPLELKPLTLDDSISELDRLNHGLDKSGADVARMSIGWKTEM